MSPPESPLRALAAVAGDLAKVLVPQPVTQLLERVCDTAHLAFAAGACSVAVVDEGTDELLYVAATGPAAEQVVGLRLPLGRGIAGYVAGSGEAMAVDDVRRDARWAADVAERVGYQPISLMASPIARGDRVLGVLTVLDRDHPGSAPTHLELAAAFAGQAAEALAIGEAVADLGRVLLRAAGEATDGDLAAALRRGASKAGEPDGELTALAAHLATLRRLGAPERAAATALLGDLVTYAHLRRGRR
ncbi:MAG TPA: GAF domain-containing protein [Acidimicrobiales bacterium]